MGGQKVSIVKLSLSERRAMHKDGSIESLGRSEEETEDVPSPPSEGTMEEGCDDNGAKLPNATSVDSIRHGGVTDADGTLGGAAMDRPTQTTRTMRSHQCDDVAEAESRAEVSKVTSIGSQQRVAISTWNASTAEERDYEVLKVTSSMVDAADGTFSNRTTHDRVEDCSDATNAESRAKVLELKVASGSQHDSNVSTKGDQSQTPCSADDKNTATNRGGGVGNDAADDGASYATTRALERKRQASGLQKTSTQCSSLPSVYNDEQRARMEENRRRALEKKQQKMPDDAVCTCTSMNNVQFQFTSSSLYSDEQRDRMEQNRREAFMKRRRLSSQTKAPLIPAPVPPKSTIQFLPPGRGMYTDEQRTRMEANRRKVDAACTSMNNVQFQFTSPSLYSDEQRDRMEKNRREALKKRRLSSQTKAPPSVPAPVPPKSTIQFPSPAAMYTDEERTRMEENRRKALERKRRSNLMLQVASVSASTAGMTPNTNSQRPSPMTNGAPCRVTMEDGGLEASDPQGQSSAKVASSEMDAKGGSLDARSRLESDENPEISPSTEEQRAHSEEESREWLTLQKRQSASSESGKCIPYSDIDAKPTAQEIAAASVPDSSELGHDEPLSPSSLVKALPAGKSGLLPILPDLQCEELRVLPINDNDVDVLIKNAEDTNYDAMATTSDDDDSIASIEEVPPARRRRMTTSDDDDSIASSEEAQPARRRTGTSQRKLDKLLSSKKRGNAPSAALRVKNRRRRAARSLLDKYAAALNSSDGDDEDGDGGDSDEFRSDGDDESSNDSLERIAPSKKRRAIRKKSGGYGGTSTRAGKSAAKRREHDSSSDDQIMMIRHVSTKKRVLRDSSWDGDSSFRDTSSDHESNSEEFQDTSSDYDSSSEDNQSDQELALPQRSRRRSKHKAGHSNRKVLVQRRKQMFDDSEDGDGDDDEGEDGANNPDELDEEPPIPPLCKNCNEAMQCKESHTESSYGKKFYGCWCQDGGDFVWLDDSDGWKRRLPSGPRCECGEPSYPILVRETRERLWVCSKTGGDTCSFELSIGDEGEQSNDINEVRRHGASEGEEFLCGVKTKLALQNFFDMENGEVRKDYRSEEPIGYYDHFRVERAWKVQPGESSVTEFEAFQRSLDDVGEGTELRDGPNRATNALAEESTASFEPLDSKSNEVLLLHGTKTEVVRDILVQGLNPDMARPGLFGRGAYFAEHPAKINQYVREDTEWKGGNRVKRYGSVCTLHNKLYPTPDLHPGNVFYCIVSRVVLGEPDCTIDRIDRPRNGGHSIIAELGNDKRLFREFVVFDKRAIKIEYVVAYTRTKRYCGCGDVVRERTYKDKDIKMLRKCIACPNSKKCARGWEGGCGMFSPLPRCFCKRNIDFDGAFPDTSQGIYRCKRRNCSFRQLIEQGVDLRELEDEIESSGTSDYSSDDGFIVKDKLYEKMKAK